MEKNNEDNIQEIIKYINTNKKVKSKIPLIISVIIYFITLILFLLYLKIAYENYGPRPMGLEPIREAIINIIIISLVIVANKILSSYYCDKIEDKNKLKKANYIIIFVIYLTMILNMTILGRGANYYSFEYNLIPFKSISEYFLNHAQYSNYAIIINVLGNIVVFMPIQYLIIKIFNLYKFKIVFVIDLIFITLIEFIQFVTGTGVFDIDDIILNILGMIIVYLVMYFIYKKNSIKDMLKE